MKHCTRCKEEKELTEFPINNKTKLGYRSRCKICESECGREWRLKKYKTKVIIEKITSIKCIVCDNPFALDYDPNYKKKGHLKHCFDNKCFKCYKLYLKNKKGEIEKTIDLKQLNREVLKKSNREVLNNFVKEVKIKNEIINLPEGYRIIDLYMIYSDKPIHQLDSYSVDTQLRHMWDFLIKESM